MTSSFEETFEDFATPHLVEQFGESVVYVSEGDDYMLTAMLLDETIEEEETESGRRQKTTLEIEIGRDPAAARGGIAEPRLDAKVRFGGKDWAIEAITAQSTYSSTLRIVRVESVERSRQKYRG